MRQRRAAFAVVLAVLCLGTVAVAEQDPLEPPDLERYLRWGPLRVRPGFRVPRLGHDDNIFLSSTDPQGDYFVTLAPRVEGLVLFGDRAFLTFEEELQYTAYLENSGVNYLDQIGKARVTFPVKGFGIFLGTRLDRVHQRPNDLDDARTKRKLNQLSAGVIVRLGWRTLLEYEIARWDWRHEDDDFGTSAVTIPERLDRDETSHRLELGYKVKGRTRLTLEASLRDIGFDTPSLLRNDGEPGPVRDARESRLVPGIEFGLGGSLTGSVDLGWSRLEHDVDSPDLPDYSGLVGEADLVYRPTRATRLELEAKRAVDFSVYEDNNYYVYDQVGLKGVRYLNRLIGLELRGALGNLTIPGTDREDDISRYGGGVRFRMMENDLGRKVEYAFTVERVRRESNVPGFNRTNNVVGVSASLGF